MSWVCIEGLDRCGKSTLAKHYESKGYEVVHMSAPNKKYFNPDYSGESYLEELVRVYSKYDGKNVVFDRTPWGELVWPNIFGRQALLNEEDLEYLSMMERNNECIKILMYDANTEAHWQRCVDNKEPLTRQQFGRANVFYERLVNDYGFIKKEFWDFPEIVPEVSKRDDSSGVSSFRESDDGIRKHGGNTTDTGSNDRSTSMGEQQHLRTESSTSTPMGDRNDNSVEDKLEKANAIRVLLQGTIVKKKGKIYDNLDESIRGFLQSELDKIFTPTQESRGGECFSAEEVAILKVFAKRIKEKHDDKST